MSDVELATIVAGLVAAVRRKFPDVDGPLVWALVACVAGIVCLVYVPGTWTDNLIRAARVAIEAIAGVSVGGYFANKAATVVTGAPEIASAIGDRESPTRPDLKSIPPPTP